MTPEAGSSGAHDLAATSSEWRENGRRHRAAAADTPSDVLEAQKRKRLELEAQETGLELAGLEEEERLPLTKVIESFLKDIKTFRKPSTHQKYEYILGLFSEYVAPKSDARDVTGEDIKSSLPGGNRRGLTLARPSTRTG